MNTEALITYSPTTVFPPSFLAAYSITGVVSIVDSTATSLQPSPPPASTRGLSTPAIIGIAVGGGGGLLLAVVCAVWLWKRRGGGKKVMPEVEVVRVEPALKIATL